mmetsp:Transcript_25691/g.72763  ORF Transcript_25691/g.72763 Transcript_25691/m.72763 type:complete len:204 (-) Transcript_25691:180-791(-)
MRNNCTAIHFTNCAGEGHDARLAHAVHCAPWARRKGLFRREVDDCAQAALRRLKPNTGRVGRRSGAGDLRWDRQVPVPDCFRRNEHGAVNVVVHRVELAEEHVVRNLTERTDMAGQPSRVDDHVQRVTEARLDFAKGRLDVLADLDVGFHGEHLHGLPTRAVRAIKRTELICSQIGLELVPRDQSHAGSALLRVQRGGGEANA